MSDPHCENCEKQLHYDVAMCGECATAFKCHEKGYAQGVEASRAQGYAEATADVVAWLNKEGAEPAQGGMRVPDMTSPAVRRELRDQAQLIANNAHVGASAKAKGNDNE